MYIVLTYAYMNGTRRAYLYTRKAGMKRFYSEQRLGVIVDFREFTYEKDAIRYRNRMTREGQITR